jgi:hypothetical protein
VGLDRALRQPQAGGHPCVRPALRHQGEDLQLALGQRVQGRTAPHERRDDHRVERTATASDAPDRVEELVDVEHAVLQQVAEPLPAADQLERELRLDVLGQHQDPDGGEPFPDLGGGARPLVEVTGRHPHIGDHDVRLVLGHQAQQGLGVARASHHVVTGVREQPGEAFTQEHGVLREHDPHVSGFPRAA